MGPEQFLQDLRERIGIEEPEALACDAADDDVIAGVRRLPRTEHVVAFGEHRLAHRGPPERFRMTFVERDDLEESIEEKGPPHTAEHRNADAIGRRIERGVRLEGLAVDADLEWLQLDGHAAERRHVPVSQRLDREGGRGVSGRTAFALHRRKIVRAGICNLSLENPT